MTELDDHWRKLEKWYEGAPINEFYRPVIRIGEGVCQIEVEVRPAFFHAAHAVHGSVYFKLLDDAGFFAANSVVTRTMVLTADFTIHLFRPVSEGSLVAKGRLIKSGSRQFVAEAQLFSAGGRLAAHGVGAYVRSRIELTPEIGYG